MAKLAKLEINRSTIAGFLSVILLVFYFIGLAVIFSVGEFPGILDIIFLFVYFYIVYKTLFKRGKLTKWEWIAALISIGWGLLSFLVGFILGFMAGAG